MGTLKEDIRTQADWLVKAFEEDDCTLDYTVESFIGLDIFFQRYSKDGELISKGRLAKHFGPLMFAISSYIAVTLLKNVPNSVLITNDKDPQSEINYSVKFPDGTICKPGLRLIKRFQNGLEDGLYPYGHTLTNDYLNSEFDPTFWNIEKEVQPFKPKPWWKFWK